MLENELYRMDHRDFKDDKSRKCLKSRSKDDARKGIPVGESRKELLQKIEKKILEYGPCALFQIPFDSC